MVYNDPEETQQLSFVPHGTVALLRCASAFTACGITWGHIHMLDTIGAWRGTSSQAQGWVKLRSAQDDYWVGHDHQAPHLYSNDFAQMIAALCQWTLRGNGALVVVQRRQRLGFLRRVGEQVDETLSESNMTRFCSETTGAILVQEGRIAGYNIVLPTSIQGSFTNGGARHRAASAISEVYDVVTVLASRSLGTISFFCGGTRAVLDPSESERWLQGACDAISGTATVNEIPTAEMQVHTSVGYRLTYAACRCVGGCSCGLGMCYLKVTEPKAKIRPSRACIVGHDRTSYFEFLTVNSRHALADLCRWLWSCCA